MFVLVPGTVFLFLNVIICVLHDPFPKYIIQTYHKPKKKYMEYMSQKGFFVEGVK